MQIPPSKSQVALISAVRTAAEIEVHEVEIAWASPEEIELIRTQAFTEGRQIMNMSLPTVKLLRAKADKVIFAWIGVDVDHNPEYPEGFSFFVDPRYRKVGAGRLLRAGIAMFLKERGFTKLYTRVALSYDSDSEAAWSACGAKRLEEGELPPHFTPMCEGCNLFGNACTSRAFLVLEVKTFYQVSATGVGPKSLGDLYALVMHEKPIVLMHPAAT